MSLRKNSEKKKDETSKINIYDDVEFGLIIDEFIDNERIIFTEEDELEKISYSESRKQKL